MNYYCQQILKIHDDSKPIQLEEITTLTITGHVYMNKTNLTIIGHP